MMAATATYVYCLLKSVARPPVRGVPGGLPEATSPRPLAIVPGIWAIVADVPLDRYGPDPLAVALRDLDWVSRAALAHESVVGHFSRRPATTVLPLKMFTMFSSPERAASEIGARRRELSAVFRRLAGAEEWGVRIALDARADRAPAGKAAAAGGAAFLAAKKQARDRAREAAYAAAEAAEEGFAALEAVARESRRREEVPPGATAPPILDAAFLVPANRRARFKAVAKAAAAGCVRAGATMTLTGPWPPYSFAQPTEGGG